MSGVNDSWLDSGHGDGRSLMPVKSALTSQSGITESPRSSLWRSRSGRTFVAVAAAAAVIGSAGTAYAIRETLFPNIGAPAARSVWQNPVPVDEPGPGAVTSSTSTTTSTPSTTSPTTSTTMPMPPTTQSDDSDARTLGTPKHSDDPPSLTGDSGGSGVGSSDPETDVATTDDPDSEADSSGSGSGADDRVGSDDSGSDDRSDELDD